MAHLVASIVVAALLMAAQGADGVTLNVPPVLGSTYAYTYISGGSYSYNSPYYKDDGSLSNATFEIFASGYVTRTFMHWQNKPRAAVDGSSRLWFLDGGYLRIMDFAGDSVTTVFPPLGAPPNVLSCNGTISTCGAVGICGADAAWTTLYISAWLTPAVFRNYPAPYGYGIIAVNLATWAYTVLPL